MKYLVSVKVPIVDKSTTRKRRFPKRDLATKFSSDLAFMKQIADDGRLRIDQGSFNTASSTGTSAEIIPNQNETFYLLSASFLQTQQISGSTTLQNDGVVRERSAFAGNNIVLLGEFSLPIDSLIGDGVKSYRMRVTNGGGTNSCSGTLVGYVESSVTLSSRGGM